MNIPKVNNTSFKGLLTISGPDKKADIIVNTNAVSTIKVQPYLGKKEESSIGVGVIEGAALTMTNGTSIATFLPIANVVEAYKKAKMDGEAELKIKYNPSMEKPLLSNL